MKKIVLFTSILLLSISSVTNGKYIVLGWNDLGMHCSNKSFSSIAILPPYNNFLAQVIQVGDLDNSPMLISDSITIEYSIPGNTYSVGKTDFWTFVEKLFGVKLADNIGLTGNGLTGKMKLATNHYVADGIPVTPYQDNNLTTESPFQMARLIVKSFSNDVLATTENVIPVSNEISCVSSGCHKSEDDILNSHSDEGGFTSANKPIICAKCHASNALGMPGHQNLGSLSYVIHRKHGSIIKTGTINDCYKCHPGPKTQCFRDAMFKLGKKCQDCHGTVSQIASSQNTGRRPWLDEPSCAASGCHAAKYAEETGKLFKNSVGHHGVYCSACHGSTHAIVPTVVDNDNQQNLKLQGYVGKLKKCSVCHGYIPTGKGPHDFLAPIPANVELVSPAKDSTGVPINHALIWKTSNNSLFYQVQLSETNDFSSLLLDTTITGTNISPTNLVINKNYYWRVRGANSYGEAFWAPAWHFTTSPENSVYEELNIANFRIEFNKTQTSALLSYQFIENTIPEIKIVNLMGILQQVSLQSQSLADSYYTTVIDISKLNSGIYFILFRKEGMSHSDKFIIKR